MRPRLGFIVAARASTVPFLLGITNLEERGAIRRLSSLTIKRRVFPKPIVGLCTNREQDHDGQSENVKR